jgi:hypothetical protein
MVVCCKVVCCMVVCCMLYDVPCQSLPCCPDACVRLLSYYMCRTGWLLLLPGFLLDKRFGVGQPKRIENAKILVANTPMDNDKIKMYPLNPSPSPSPNRRRLLEPAGPAGAACSFVCLLARTCCVLRTAPSAAARAVAPCLCRCRARAAGAVRPARASRTVPRRTLHVYNVACL